MKEPVKVLIMDTVMDRGGSEAMTMNFMRHMDRSKVQYDFLVHRSYKAAYEDEIEQLGGKIYRICPVYPQYFDRYKREIRRFFQEHKEYKIIHSNTMELGYFAYKEAKRQGIPVIICHSHTTPRGFDVKTIFRTYFKIRMRKDVTHMFACSLTAGEWLFGKKNRDKIKIIKNPIETEKYIFNKVTRDRIRQEFGIKEDQFVVGHVGRFFPQKNHEFLIDIFKCIHDKDSDAILMLIGGGEHGENDESVQKIRKKVEKLGLKDCVLFVGVRSDVAALMQAMDVFVFPSKWEGFGIVLIEAQAAGLRCFTSENTVPKDVQITELLTYISLKEKAETWASYVLQCKGNYTRRNCYQDVVNAGYDIKKNAELMQDFYCQVLENGEITL